MDIPLQCMNAIANSWRCNLERLVHCLDCFFPILNRSLRLRALFLATFTLSVQDMPESRFTDSNSALLYSFWRWLQICTSATQQKKDWNTETKNNDIWHLQKKTWTTSCEFQASNHVMTLQLLGWSPPPTSNRNKWDQRRCLFLMVNVVVDFAFLGNVTQGLIGFWMINPEHGTISLSTCPWHMLFSRNGIQTTEILLGLLLSCMSLRRNHTKPWAISSSDPSVKITDGVLRCAAYQGPSLLRNSLSYRVVLIRMRVRVENENHPSESI